ncbi:hypothetical protein AcV7_008139 [Taiwanofungus camphoratus]|nr:hypothetical protein AcV7_008139 [Antrodia cinnamomea]
MAENEDPPRSVSRYTRLWSAHRHLRDLPQSRPTSLVLHFLLVCLHVLLTAALIGVGATQMNSLAYLSRQFDVLASPRAPPSAPVSESLRSLSHAVEEGDTPLKRVRTWSTKSFLVQPPANSSTGTSALKRSFSSPGEVNPTGPASEPSSRPPQHPSVPSSKHPSGPVTRRLSVSSIERATRPKTASGSTFRHLLFVRIVLLLWNSLCAAWRSITRQGITRATDGAAVEDGTDEEEKDTEDESKDEKSVLLDLPQSPFQHAIPPPLSPSPSSPSAPTSPAFPLPIVSHPPSEVFTSSNTTSDIQAPSPAAIPSTTPIPAVSQINTASRSSTPTAITHKTPFHLPKTLVLDLDETLIHATSRPMLATSSSGSGLLGLSMFGRGNKGAGHMVEVVLGGRSTLYHVYKRPFVDYFLRKVSGWYTLVIFTASMQEYADPVIDWLDAGRGILTRRLFRESCTQLPNGSYTKDLSIVEQDLARICLIDNSPICYSVNEANGIPIEGWTHDPHDEALLDLLPVLDSLRFTSDVRRILGIRGFS